MVPAWMCQLRPQRLGLAMLQQCYVLERSAELRLFQLVHARYPMYSTPPLRSTIPTFQTPNPGLHPKHAHSWPDLEVTIDDLGVVARCCGTLRPLGLSRGIWLRSRNVRISVLCRRGQNPDLLYSIPDICIEQDKQSRYYPHSRWESSHCSARYVNA